MSLQDVQALKEEFLTQASETLSFLKKIKQLKFFSIKTKNNTPVEEYSLQLELVNHDLNELERFQKLTNVSSLSLTAGKLKLNQIPFSHVTY